MSEHTDSCLAYQTKMGLAFCNCDCKNGATEHVHEWKKYTYSFRCGCGAILGWTQVTVRLNEYETLRAALNVVMSENQRLTKLVEDYEEE